MSEGLRQVLTIRLQQLLRNLTSFHNRPLPTSITKLRLNMAIQQELSKRYIDKEKLGNFWRTHPDFQGQSCVLEVIFTE